MLQALRDFRRERIMVDTRGSDPFCVKRPVSEGRMARPTPFETKRKKAPIGAPGRIQYLNVAEGKGLISNLLWAGNELKSLFSTRAPRDLSAIGMTLDGGADAADRHHLIW